VTTAWLTSRFGFEWRATVDLIAFTVLEHAQGGVDLTGDGEAGDKVVHSLDLASGVLTNHGLALDCIDPALVWPCGGNEGDLFLAPGRLAVGVSEQAMGSDLDGDGQVDINLGVVHHLVELDTGAVHNLRTRAGVSSWDGPVYALDGDRLVAISGVASGLDVALFDAATGCLATPGLGAYYSTVNDLVRPQLGDGFVLFERDESATGVDLNGDGDLADFGHLVLDVPAPDDGPCARPY
jgi:hypothetical protein